MSEAEVEMFGPYRIEDLLGRGGMGEVHRAYDTVQERYVALKRLTSPSAGRLRDRFVREARIAEQLREPHIVPVHDHGEIADQLYLDLRLIDGTDLKRLLADGPLEPRRAVRILSQVALALDAAHSAGIVHRDVKPANILLDSGETAYLGDFGIARLVDVDTTLLTATGEQIGTLDYMAPERLSQDAGAVGAVSDVYSLACVLFECLTGRVPFPAPDAVGKLAAQLGDPPPTPSLFDSRNPPALDLVVRTGMDKDPRRRYPTAGELMAAAVAVVGEDVAAPERAIELGTGRAGADEPGRRHFVEALVGVAGDRTTLPIRYGDLDACPYPGLQSFGVADHDWFFGREREVSDLLVRLSRQGAESGPLMLVGASGAGKSSLLNAGVLAAHVTEDGPAPRISLTPGERPIDTLAARMAARTRTDPAEITERLRQRPTEFGELCGRITAERGAPLLVTVDQLEELFTRCADSDERDVFVTALTHAWPARVVLAVRADFIEPCIALPGLKPALGAPYVVGPLDGAAVRRAITQPAAAAGLELEEGLTDRLITDVGARDGAGCDPGALPRLAHALRETWNHRDGQVLTLRGYQQTGGVDRAVALSADGVYARLAEPDRHLFRAALLRMVTPLEGDGVARRPARREEVSQGLLEDLVHARLVTVDQDSVSLAHDALLTAWPRLREWVEEDRSGLIVRQQLGVAATAWQDGGRDRADLYRGARLSAAVDQREHRDDLTPVEREFLDSSERERRRGTRRLGAVIAGLATLLVVALVAGALAVVSRNDAAQKGRVAESRQLAAESLGQADVNPVQSMRKALQSWTTAPTREARDALLSAPMLTYPDTIDSGLDTSFSVDSTADGSVIAVGGVGRIVLWDVDSRTPRQLDVPGGAVTAARFSPDGRLLATSALDSDDEPGGVTVWDVDSGRKLQTIEHVLPAIGPIAWRPDGQAIAASTIRDESTVSVGEWDPRTGRPLRWIADTGALDASSLAYSPDGNRFAIGRGTGSVELWDPDRARMISRMRQATATGGGIATVQVAFSDELLASASPMDNQIRLWDPASGTPIRQVTDVTRPSGEAGQGPSAITFTPDGSRLYANSDSGTITSWDPVSGAYVRSLPEGQRPKTTLGAAVLALAVSGDGRTSVAVTTDGTVLRWYANPSWYLQPSSSVMSLAIRPDGQAAAAGDADGTLNTWKIGDGTPTEAPTSLGSAVMGLTYTRDGRRITATQNATFTVDGPPEGPEREVTVKGRRFDGVMAVSADGSTLAAALKKRSGERDDDPDYRLYVWDTDTLSTRAVVDLGNDVPTTLTFSPDGKRLLALTNQKTVTVQGPDGEPGTSMVTWSVPGYAEEDRLPLGRDSLTSAVFTPDGTSIITAGTGGVIELRDIDTGRVRSSFGRHPSTIRRLALSPNGKTLASLTTEDSVVRLWDLADRELVANLTGHTAPLNQAVFSPDGRRLATAGSGGDVAIWRIRPDDAVQQLCTNLAEVGQRAPGSAC